MKPLDKIAADIEARDLINPQITLERAIWACAEEIWETAKLSEASNPNGVEAAGLRIMARHFELRAAQIRDAAVEKLRAKAPPA